MVNTQLIPYVVFTRYLPVYLPGYLPVLPPNLVFTWVFTQVNTQVNTRSVFTCRFLRNTQVNTRSVFTCRFLRSPYYQICEITQFFEKFRTKMGNNPVCKKVKYLQFKSKYLGIYLFT